MECRVDRCLLEHLMAPEVEPAVEMPPARDEVSQAFTVVVYGPNRGRNVAHPPTWPQQPQPRLDKGEVKVEVAGTSALIGISRIDAAVY